MPFFEEMASFFINKGVKVSETDFYTIFAPHFSKIKK